MNATQPLIPVMATARLLAFPKNPTGGKVDYLPLKEALGRSYGSDAHIAAYSVPSVARRLSRDAVGAIEGGVQMVAVLFDIDGHAAQNIDAWFDDERPKIKALLAAHPAAHVYRTRGGYRIVYRTSGPILITDRSDASAWSSLYGAWTKHLRRCFGIVADPACKDWQRLYRAPRATRDPGGSPEDREVISNPDVVGTWGWGQLSATDLDENENGSHLALVTSGRLIDAFRSRGWLGTQIEPGKHTARCPWERGHSTGASMDGSTVLYEPQGDRTLGYLHCSHASCATRTVPDVLALFSDEELGTTVRPMRALRNHSYLSAVTIVEQNLKGVVGGPLSLNEMTATPMVGARPLVDADFSRIRGEIERHFVGGEDKDGNKLGLSLCLDDVRNAVLQAALASPYHPVRQYLNGLQWDGEARLSRYAVEILGAAPTPLNTAMLRKWFISAVARPLKPGCKVDTVLILVGAQGARKSTTFSVLVGEEYFVDSPIDVSSKDAFGVLRRAWILEWAELESMQRARNGDAAKAFITSTVDTYRPAYGRLDVQVARTGVIVGSTNQDEFLTDETGNRRYWPVTVGKIDIDKLRVWRDQLWAEAVVAYRAGESWWLDSAQDQDLAKAQEAHVVTDAWETPVYAWTNSHLSDGFSTAEVLNGALEKPAGQWGKQDAMRVAKLLRAGGWTQKKVHGGRRLWVK